MPCIHRCSRIGLVFLCKPIVHYGRDIEFPVVRGPEDVPGRRRAHGDRQRALSTYTGVRVEEVRLQTKKLIALTVFVGLSAGLVYGQAAAPQSDVAQRIAAVEACLPPPVIVKGEPKACTTLTKRMEELHVPGVSVAVVHNGA